MTMILIIFHLITKRSKKNSRWSQSWRKTCVFHDALEKVIAEDIISKVNIPNFDKSPWWLCFQGRRCCKCKRDNPVVLEVIDVIMAGDVSEKSVSKGQAVRLMDRSKSLSGIKLHSKGRYLSLLIWS